MWTWFPCNNFFSSEQTAPFLGKMLNTRSENVSNPSEYRLEASKAPKWSIWVPDLNNIYPLINIWKPALTDLGLKSWSKFKFWTWSIQQILTLKNTFVHTKKAWYYEKTALLLIRKHANVLLKNMYIYRPRYLRKILGPEKKYSA